MSCSDLRRLNRRGEWHSPGHGTVAPFARGDDIEAAILAATSSVLTRRSLTVSERSAALIHDLPVIDVPTRPFVAPELVGSNVRQRRQPSAHVRSAMLWPDHRALWFGAPVTNPARTVVDLAMMDRRQGLVAADAALRSGRLDRGHLLATANDLSGRPGSAQARALLAIANPLSESPLESITRLALHDHKVPPPQLQVWIVDPGGGWRVRVDMGWLRHKLVLEADGRVKYTGDALWREKIRQERLEQLGYRVLRTNWYEVTTTPDLLAARVLRGLRR